MYSLTWLAEVLRAAGLTVVEHPGWQTRGHGDFGPARGVLIHHTGSNPHGGVAPDVPIVINGRPDLAGPLCNLLLDREGTWHAIAAGHASHAGAGYWHGVTAGNSELIGVEAENNGVDEPWPAGQVDSLARGSAALLEHINADSVMCAGHKEYALPKGRKVDPDFDMVAFRERVGTILEDGGAPAMTPIAQTDPERSMLRKGDMGDSVEVLQTALGLTGDDVDGDFGPKTDALVRSFQTAHGLKPDGLVGPATWKALGH